VTDDPPTGPDGSDNRDHPIAEDAYDELAETYAAELEQNPYNVDLDFPGTTALIPDVEGKCVLDAGCGTGLYTEWLVERGADVVGVDVSEEMLARASEREVIGDDVEFHRVDLGEPLDFAGDDAFDGIVCGLVLGYIGDWESLFDEFARVLTPGGFVVFSLKHPFDEWPLDEDENYFDVERKTKEWSVEVPFFSRPLEAIFGPPLDAGFRIDRVAEPEPTEGFAEKWPERYEKETKRPVFLALRVVLPPG
jgi:SAM-dependent methyltransferase